MGVSLRVAYCKVVTGLGFSTSLCGQSYCSDSFDNLDNWQLPAKSGWEVQNGEICSNSDGWNDYAYNTCSQSQPPADYVINIDSATLFNGNGYGVFFRLQDTGSKPNGYIFQYDPGAHGFLIRKWVNGYEINPSLAYKSASGYSWYNQPRKIQVIVKGNTFTAFVDDVELFTITDNTYTKGGVGLRYWANSRVCMDGFSVAPLP